MEANLALQRGASLVLLLSSFLTVSDSSVSTHVLNTRLGALEGVKKEARHQKYFYAYYGIPYARPPVGKLRFEPPVPAEPWSGILNATQPPPPCPQLTDVSDTNTYTGQEDCIFLHVYTPVNAKRGANLPVLFYIFGGLFKKKKPTDYEPDFLMSRDIVMVMVSYRLGMLGFLSTGDTVISGNMALKDQVMALKWTKENIYDFGGDPNRITLQGHSSGAVCVHLHTLSPRSKDYFNQVIIQSGFGYPPAVTDRDFAKAVSRDLAVYFNCSVLSSEGLKQCLQNITARELVLATEKFSIIRVTSDPVRPVIEDERVGSAFLTANPLFLPYQSNSKPWMLGITTGEGASFVDRFFRPGSSVLDIDPKLLLPVVADLIWPTKPSHVDFIAQLIRTQFFEGEEVKRNENADVALVKIMTGIRFGSPFIDIVRKYEGLKYVYLFDYRYVGGFSHSQGGRNGRFIGVAHADELPLIFKENKTGIAEEDFRFGDEIITRWVNFIYSGNPNSPFPINTNVFGAWSPVSTSRIEFLRIIRNGSMESDYFLQEYNRWKKIPLLSKYFNS